MSKKGQEMILNRLLCTFSAHHEIISYVDCSFDCNKHKIYNGILRQFTENLNMPFQYTLISAVTQVEVTHFCKFFANYDWLSIKTYRKHFLGSKSCTNLADFSVYPMEKILANRYQPFSLSI